MTFVSAFTQFNRGFLSGAGFSLGVGVSSFVNRSLFGLNMALNPFGFCNPFTSFNPFFASQLGFFMGYNLSTSEFNKQSSYQNCGCCNTSIFGNITPLNINTDTFGSSYTPINFGSVFMGGPLIMPPQTDNANDEANSGSGGVGEGAYASLSREQALEKAKNDPNLEELKGGTGWELGQTFDNDIPYARKGTGQLLAEASRLTGEKLTVTSALGTATSPHTKGSGTASHYNEKNPKLDFGGGYTEEKAKEMAEKLMETNLFEFVTPEDNKDGTGHWHLDVKFKDSEYENIA